jgi:hypothetical protein
MDWPIVYDPINVLRLKGVPVSVAIDEYGIVRSTRAQWETLETEFLERTFAPEAGSPAGHLDSASLPSLEGLQRRAEKSRSPDAWRELGDSCVLWGRPAKLDEAIEAYAKAHRISPDDGDALFRMGACHLMRYESERGLPTDFQRAVDLWSQAVSIDPNQYIWRRRIQQYGPRLAKPYPFYDWVEIAAREIKARGEEPTRLPVLPTGAELARPARHFGTDGRVFESPDPDGRVLRDTERLVIAEITVVPPTVRPEESVRVHVTLRPNGARKVHWNNEAGPVRLWIEKRPGWDVQPRLLETPPTEKPESTEPRHLEFEVRAASKAKGRSGLSAYVLYYVCEDVDGTCMFLRQDIVIPVKVRQ